MSSADATQALRAAVERLEQLTVELAERDLPPARSRALAEEALELSGEISALLPRALQEGADPPSVKADSTPKGSPRGGTSV